MSNDSNPILGNNLDPNCPVIVDGVFARFCLDLQTAAKNAFAYAQQDPLDVHIGHMEFFKEQEFYKEVAHNGFELFIGPTQGKANAYDINGDFHCLGELIYNVPADQPVSLIPIMKMKALLYVAWSTYYQTRAKGGNRTPLTIEDGEIDYKSYVKPFILTTTFTFTQNFIISQASDPFLVPTLAQQS